jgi:hypothetical protein
MDARKWFAGLGVASLLLIGGASPLASVAQAQSATVNPADYSATIDHPLFPLTEMAPKLLAGASRDSATGQVSKERVELRVPPATEIVAGVEVTVLEEFGYVDGQLDEHSRDYFAQGKDGTIYLFGERVDHFQDGKLIEQPGTWLVGQDVPVPTVYLPAELAVDQTFVPEEVPGLVKDVATVVALDQVMTTSGGAFEGCATIRVADDQGDIVDRSLCAGVGLVQEVVPTDGGEPQGGIELVKLGGWA